MPLLIEGLGTAVDMEVLTGHPKAYAWGSLTAIPELLGNEPDGSPLAELWFGAHPGGPALTSLGHSLADTIAADPVSHLGDDVVERFGSRLPYLAKFIAPAAPLSMQVHPSLERARERFSIEEAAGIDIGARHRNYKDPNHKPELILALQRFEALCGFRAPRRAAELLDGIDHPVIHRALRTLRSSRGGSGIRRAFFALVGSQDGPEPHEVAAIAQACVDRLEADQSPSQRTDRIVGNLQRAYPGDPGVVAALLLNPVTLHPGEALFVPAGSVHAYLSGCGIEVMANSDNVLRAGLTPKHVDVDEVMASVNFIAAPPVRPAPEYVTDDIGVYYAPVEDFQLSLATVNGQCKLRGNGPRIIMGVSDNVTVTVSGKSENLRRGTVVYLPASAGPAIATGQGVLAQVDVP